MSDMPQERPGARLLVIDDERGLRDMFARVIGSLGYQVVTAPNGEEGVALARAEPFDAVFCDIMMPGISGIEVMQILRREKPELPVVIMTGYPNAESEQDALALGAAAFMAKPCTIEEIEAVIDKIVKKGGKP